MYTPRRTNLKFKILFEDIYAFYIIQIYIYLLKRKFTENVVQNTPSWTIDEKSGEYTRMPLKIVCAVTHYLLFLYKILFLQFFLQNFSKISSITHQIALFLKIFSGEHAHEPPSKRVALPRSVWRFASCKYPHFSKKYFHPPEMKS